MVVFDATTLLLLVSPKVPAPQDPITKEPIKFAKERIDYLVKELEQKKTKIIIPTPALSEILVRAETAGPEYLALINASASFKIVPFDVRAAVEVASMTARALADGDKRSGVEAPWTKIKYDRQIVAIAKIERATAIYTDDSDIHKFAAIASIRVIGVGSLPLPPDNAQGVLFIPPQTRNS